MMIQRNDKKTKKNTEISQVLHLANTAVTDIIFRLVDNLDKSNDSQHDIDSFLREIDEIMKYCNEIFKDIAFTYNIVQYGFNEFFNFITVPREKKGRKKAAVAIIDDEDNNDNDNDSIFSNKKN
jgi:hypothetical protein